MTALGDNLARLSTLWILSFFVGTIPLWAQIKPSAIFTDNMVLQQQTLAPIWGKATPGQNIKVITSWDNQIYDAKAGADGSWKVDVNTHKAGGPHTISISDGREEIELKNVMLGEVWICSGQSNMEMLLAGRRGKVLNSKAEIAAADYPNIRLLQVDKVTAVRPLSELKTSSGGWQACSPATVVGFSSVAYFFGRNLYQNMDSVPIGLIEASWGGTIAEAWTSKEALETMPHFRDVVQKIPSESTNPNKPTVLYNGMIHPIIPYSFQGVIWYQGESNVDRAYQYRELFPLMIRSWRQQWNRNFPFYFVQLANFRATKSDPEESEWAELREAQMHTLSLENTGMAVAIDIGEADDIHPKNKQDVGIRLALVARANTYNQAITYSGPLYDTYKIEGDKMRILFKNTDGGLKTKNDQLLKGFSIAGSDHKFYWANAVVDGDNVIVCSTIVPFPVAVRYAWADNPDCNLYNGFGLPASPFRTDDWRQN